MTLQNLWYFLDVRRRWQGKVSDGKRNAQCSHIHTLFLFHSLCLSPSVSTSLSLSHSDCLSLSPASSGSPLKRGRRQLFPQPPSPSHIYLTSIPICGATCADHKLHIACSLQFGACCPLDTNWVLVPRSYRHPGQLHPYVIKGHALMLCLIS